MLAQICGRRTPYLSATRADLPLIQRFFVILILADMADNAHA